MKAHFKFKTVFSNISCFILNSIVFLVLNSFLLSSCHTASTVKDELEVNFKNPPIENRPLALWAWLNGFVDTAQLVYELEEMKAKGMRGAFIWDVGALADPEKMIPAGPEFLGKESLEYISLTLNTAKRLGLDIGLFASSSWNAGGPWITEADASKELLSTIQTLTGPSRQKITIHVPQLTNPNAKAYTLISSIAVPHSDSKVIDYTQDQNINLDKYTLENKFIEWEIPNGEWDIISFFMCNTGQNLECPSPNSNGLIIDHLSKKATKTDFDTMLTRLAKVLTPENQLKFLELDSYEVRPARDWSPDFLEEFKIRYGYDLKSYLPLLQGYRSKDSILNTRLLGDYNRLVSDMIIENHFAQSVEIAHKNKMEMYSEAGHGGYARVDPLKALGNSDVPMGEFWNRQKNWVTKEAASAAHIYGKKLVAAESLTGWQNWQHGPTDFKQLFDIAFCAGLNQVVFHNFAHSPKLAGKPGFAYHAGEHINVNTSWWEMARPFMDYLSRCSYLLRQGNFVGDLCIYYGDDAPNQVPARRIDPNIIPRYPEGTCLHCGVPKPVDPGKLIGYDYDYINSDIIIQKLKVEGERLVLPSGQSYKLMLLPDRDDISLEVLKSIEKLVFQGATIIGRKPMRSNSLKNFPQCDDEVLALAEKIWGKCDGKTVQTNHYGKGTVHYGKTVAHVLDELNIPPDFEVKDIDNSERHIDYIHQNSASEDIYFISNSAREQKKFTGMFRVNQNKIPELWDAETGLIQRKIKYSKVANGISIEFILDAFASRFVVFRNKSTGADDKDINSDLQFGFDPVSNSQTGNPTRLDISTQWKVSFDTAMGGPAFYILDSLRSWSEIGHDGIKYYSGTAIYEKEFLVDQENLKKETKAYLFFEEIQEMIHVFVNDQDCGITWTPPFKTYITPFLKVGQNKITVQVVNTWNNRILGDLKSPSKKYSNTNIKNRFKPDAPLLKSGLVGKAEIIFTHQDE